MAEPQAPGGVSKALNAAWVRPFLFLIFIVVAWDLAIRLFRIPAYQIPAPADVVAVLWQDWPELAAPGLAHHLCDDLRLPVVGRRSAFPSRC